MMRRVSVVCLCAVVLSMFIPFQAVAAPTIDKDFTRTWDRTDLPVALQWVQRTWMWGPGPYTRPMFEYYADSPNYYRVVQYFDKSRMEVTNPNGDRNSSWYVTNGLLAKELITGQLQEGDNQFWQYAPANVNVAGDADDATGPTYATFNTVLGYSPVPTGWAITQTINRHGEVGNDSRLAGYGVTAAYHVPETNHTVASVFWDFMNSSGHIYENGVSRYAPLFENAFYATGFPLTEAYWTYVKVGGLHKRVLVQVFERRVLTFTPDNPDEWRVEAGNVGQHYYAWRYGLIGDKPCPVPEVPSNESPPLFWQDPELAVSVALTGLGQSTSSLYAQFLQENAHVIRNIYHLHSAAVGCFNPDTHGFMPWLTGFLTDPLNDENRQYLIAQMEFVFYYPNSPVASTMRHISTGGDPLWPASGYLAYWHYVIEPTQFDASDIKLNLMYNQLQQAYVNYVNYTSNNPSGNIDFPTYVVLYTEYLETWYE